MDFLDTLRVHEHSERVRMNYNRMISEVYRTNLNRMELYGFNVRQPEPELRKAFIKRLIEIGLGENFNN